MKTNTVIQGHIGGGKTRSALTLLPEYEDERGKVRKGAGLETFLLAMEPGYQHVLRSHSCKQGIHVHYHVPDKVDWDTIAFYAGLMRNMSVKEVSETPDRNKRNYTGFYDLMTTVCKNFICDTCGNEFGDISTWDESRALVLDSLTPLSDLIRQCVVGGKPISSQPEYYTMYGFALNFIRLLFQQCQCSVVLTAHIDREQHPVLDRSVLTVDTIGQKLAVQICKMPDELVTAYTENGKDFYWSNATLHTGQVVKRRALPLGEKLAPDFSLIFKPPQ